MRVTFHKEQFVSLCGVRFSRYCWILLFLWLWRCLSSFACLLYICLSSGAHVICHLLRALRLSVNFCLIYKGLLSDRGWGRGGGVANLAACWISAVRIATAVSMSDLDFSGICLSIRSSRVCRVIKIGV